MDEVGGVACRRAGASGAAPGPRTGCSIMRLYTSSSSPHTSWPRVTPPLPPRPPWLSLLPSRSSCISSSYCSSLYFVFPPPPFSSRSSWLSVLPLLLIVQLVLFCFSFRLLNAPLGFLYSFLPFPLISSLLFASDSFSNYFRCFIVIMRVLL